VEFYLHTTLRLDDVHLYVFIVLSLFTALRRIFGPRRDEVTEEWRRLHNKELYALYV
jgi:hypothetical protein